MVEMRHEISNTIFLPSLIDGPRRCQPLKEVLYAKKVQAFVAFTLLYERAKGDIQRTAYKGCIGDGLRRYATVCMCVSSSERSLVPIGFETLSPTVRRAVRLPSFQRIDAAVWGGINRIIIHNFRSIFHYTHTHARRVDDRRHQNEI